MKIAVIGASGNHGTAVLRALAADETIEHVAAVARRFPDRDAEPYARATWHRVDVAAPAVDEQMEDAIVDRLADAIAGADCAIHLAWLIQPNRKRDLLRRGNVGGTRRVVAACLRAGVPHLVCASSVGAYGTAGDDVSRDESWPTTGIATSHYSVDKAAQEQVLDDAEAAGLKVARLRPALTFAADAGAEIVRLFIGPAVPAAALAPGSLPALPLPAGLRLQAVHAADLAEAYRLAAVTGASGAFNIAADDLLRGPDLADALDHGTVVHVPVAAVRRAVAIAYKLRLVAADPGWLDMGMGVPVMDTSRARTQLGWAPRRSAKDALTELLAAMADGAGAPSAPMRERRTWPQDQAPPGQIRPDRLVRPVSGEPDHRIPPEFERDLLALYLADHLTGATAGVGRATRMARAYADTDMGADLADVATQIEEEWKFVGALLDALESPVRRHRLSLAGIAERAGRLKTNDRPSGSPMTPLLEIELLRSAIVGKLGGWQTLTHLADDLALPPALFERLIDRADHQLDVLDRLHEDVAGRALYRAP